MRGQGRPEAGERRGRPEIVRYRKEEYGRFIEEFRASLDGWKRVAGFGLVLAADRGNSKVVAAARALFTVGKAAGE